MFLSESASARCVHHWTQLHLGPDIHTIQMPYSWRCCRRGQHGLFPSDYINNVYFETPVRMLMGVLDVCDIFDVQVGAMKTMATAQCQVFQSRLGRECRSDASVTVSPSTLGNEDSTLFFISVQTETAVDQSIEVSIGTIWAWRLIRKHGRLTTPWPQAAVNMMTPGPHVGKCAQSQLLQTRSRTQCDNLAVLNVQVSLWFSRGGSVLVCQGCILS